MADSINQRENTTPSASTQVSRENPTGTSSRSRGGTVITEPLQPQNDDDDDDRPSVVGKNTTNNNATPKSALASSSASSASTHAQTTSNTLESMNKKGQSNKVAPAAGVTKSSKEDDDAKRQQQQQQQQQHNTGNDQVSVDVPRKPLVSSSTSTRTTSAENKSSWEQQQQQEADFLPPASSVPSHSPAVVAAASDASATASKSNILSSSGGGGGGGGSGSHKNNTASVKPAAAQGGGTTESSADQSQQQQRAAASAAAAALSNSGTGSGTGSQPNTPSDPTTAQAAVAGAPPPSSSSCPSPIMIMDEQSLLEEKLKEERAPLTDKYGHFIVPSDTCLEDARRRLHTALEQTRQLRAAFTERVYRKYRVCLKPPSSTEQILTRTLTDPAQIASELEEEILQCNEEKTWEKKEAAKLNSEMMAITNTTAAAPAAPSSASPSSPTTTATATPATTATPSGSSNAVTPSSSNTPAAAAAAAAPADAGAADTTADAGTADTTAAAAAVPPTTSSTVPNKQNNSSSSADGGAGITPPPAADPAADPAATSTTAMSTTDAAVSSGKPSDTAAGTAPATAPGTAPAITNPLEVMNAENAEQLMYISAGLSLIIHPEQDITGMRDLDRMDTNILASYKDRAPIHPTTGQRVKGISAAAAAAGDVMLDRARKAAAMRAERIRRKEQGLDPLNYSRLEFLANNPVMVHVPPPSVIPPASQPTLVAATQVPAAGEAGASSGAAAKTTSASAVAAAVSSTVKKARSTTSTTAAVTMSAANNNKATPVAAPIAAASASSMSTVKASNGSASSGTKRSLAKSSSTPSVAAAAVANTTAPSIPSAAAKAIRARVQATMSVQTLLSLSPSCEELRTDGKLSAATLALMERGVGNQGQNSKAQQQQRFRHPHPDSQGGRRRALQSGSSSSASNKQQQQQDASVHPSFMAINLPPLPTAKERRTRRRVPKIVTDPARKGSQRAKEVIRKVLEQFSDNSSGEERPLKRRRMSEISFLHGIQDFGDGKSNMSDLEEKGQTAESSSGSALPKLGAMDPMLAFHVMQAVGLIQPSASVDDGKSSVDELIFPANLETGMFAIAEKRAMGDEGGVSRRSISRLQKLHKKFTSSSHQTFSRSVFHPPAPHPEAANATNENKSVPADVDSNPSQVESGNPGPENSSQVHVPVLPIRGGGEALNENGDVSNDNQGQVAGNATSSSTPKPQVNSVENGTNQANKSDLASSSRPVVGHQQQHHSPQANVWNDSSRLVLLNPTSVGHASNMARLAGHIPGVEHYHPNAIQLANQLRLSRMPAQGHHGGDLADYIGGLHPQAASGYDWAAVSAASAAAALGMAPHRAALVNFPLQDRARAMLRDQTAASAAAHAAVAHRHQQALAYLSGGHGYPTGSSPHFAHMGGGIMNPQVAFMGHGGMAPVPAQNQAQQSATADVAPPPNNSRKEDAKPKTTAGSAKAKEEISSVPLNENKKLKESTGAGDATELEKSKKRKLPDEEAVDSQPEKQAKTSQKEPPSSLVQTPTNAAVKLSQDAPKEEPAPVAPDGVTDRKPVPSEGNEKNFSPDLTAASTDTELKQASSGSSGPGSTGLQFFVPPAPPEIPTDIASCVLQARCQEAVKMSGSLGQTEKSSLVAYVCAVGTAVPIPKTLVANLFKERLNAPPLKSTAIGGIPQSSRDAAVATILLWLWKRHEQCFQRAFAKSGRIDVEPECKWLVSAAVEKAASSLGQALEDKTSRSSTPLAISLMAIKGKGSSSQKANQEKPAEPFVTAPLDLLVVSIVAKGLTTGLKVNTQADASLPHFNDLLDYLDETRKCALHSKSQERALLAALISRKATMSLSFSHAYVSSMVRAGEALGHGDLFEVVQNEEVNVSTMIPYDVFTDETGAWEDPCRPPDGFNANLTGDDLMRQAHARAMIQKSLKKLQDRHNIKGGTQVPGAYTDPPNTGNASDSNRSTASASGGSTPRGSHKRRSSFSGPPVQPGTGSAVATTWALYDPKHYSLPLEWEPDSVENTPYGQHNSANRPRSLSLSQFTLKLPSRGRGRRSVSVSSPPEQPLKEPEPDNGPMKRSTREIPWVDVAGIFQNVALPGTPKQPDVPATPRGRTIFAPYVRQVDLEDVDAGNENESDEEEEDLRDEMVLGRHQVVLDRMKEHLSAFLEARQKSQGKKKSRSSKT